MSKPTDSTTEERGRKRIAPKKVVVTTDTEGIAKSVHPVRKAHKDRNEKPDEKTRYYKFATKEEIEKKVPEIESSIANLYRYFLGPDCAPKNIVVEDAGTLSREIPGYQPFAEYRKVNSQQSPGEHAQALIQAGLGALYVANYLLQENDCHSGNFGFNEKKQISRLDFNQCLLKFTAPEWVSLGYCLDTVTDDDLLHLTAPITFKTYNSPLEASPKEPPFAKAVIDAAENNEKFLFDKWKTAIKSFLLTKEMIRKMFVNHFDSSEESERVINACVDHIYNRFQTVREHLIEIPQFLEFVEQHKAELERAIVGEINEYNQEFKKKESRAGRIIPLDLLPQHFDTSEIRHIESLLKKLINEIDDKNEQEKIFQVLEEIKQCVLKTENQVAIESVKTFVEDQIRFREKDSEANDQLSLANEVIVELFENKMREENDNLSKKEKERSSLSDELSALKKEIDFYSDVKNTLDKKGISLKKLSLENENVKKAATTFNVELKEPKVTLKEKVVLKLSELEKEKSEKEPLLINVMSEMGEISKKVKSLERQISLTQLETAQLEKENVFSNAYLEKLRELQSALPKKEVQTTQKDVSAPSSASEIMDETQSQPVPPSTEKKEPTPVPPSDEVEKIKGLIEKLNGYLAARSGRLGRFIRWIKGFFNEEYKVTQQQKELLAQEFKTRLESQKTIQESYSEAEKKVKVSSVSQTLFHHVREGRLGEILKDVPKPKV